MAEIAVAVIAIAEAAVFLVGIPIMVFAEDFSATIVYSIFLMSIVLVSVNVAQVVSLIFDY